jgi:hypothetical protein
VAQEWVFVGVSNVVALSANANHDLVTTGISGLQQGDLLVACISSRIASASTVTLPTGGEWTLIGQQNANNTLTTSSAIPSATMAFCIRGASDPNLTFVHPTTPSIALGRIVAYRNTGIVKDTQTAQTTGTATTSVSVTGLTAARANSLIVAMTAGGQEATWTTFDAATAPSVASSTASQTGNPTADTWLERADSSSTTGADTSLGIFDAVKVASGATGNLTVTAGTSAAHSVIAVAFYSTVHDHVGTTLTVTSPSLVTAPDFDASAGGLAADNLTISSPVLGTPALGQKHVLGATALAVASPVLGTPNAICAVASALTVSSPALGTPNLICAVANSLTVSSPALGTPLLVGVFSAANLTVSSPALDSPVLNQKHGLGASNLAVDGPELGTPNAICAVASGLTTASPVLGTPLLIGVFSAANLTVSSPVLGTPVATSGGGIAANPLEVGSPVLGTPAIGQNHVLGASELATGSPVPGTPALVDVAVMTTAGHAAGSPVRPRLTT